MMENIEKKSIKELLQLLVKENEEDKKDKEKKKTGKFSIPFLSRLSRGNLKKGYVTVCYIQDNKEVKFFKTPINESVLMAEGRPHLALAEYMLTYKGKPMLIIPSWNLEPFSSKGDIDSATERKTLHVGYRHLMNVMEDEKIKPKMQINWKMIGLAVLVIGGMLYLINSGTFRL